MLRPLVGLIVWSLSLTLPPVVAAVEVSVPPLATPVTFGAEARSLDREPAVVAVAPADNLTADNPADEATVEAVDGATDPAVDAAEEPTVRTPAATRAFEASVRRSSSSLMAPPAAAPAAKPKGPFAQVPPVAVFPRLGLFPVVPTGAGYYSAADAVTGTYRKAPPPFPWGRFSLKAFPFYDSDFRYLDNPKNTYHNWSDGLKRRRVGEGWLFSSGGEFRDRYMHEVDSRLGTALNTNELTRSTVWGSLWYRDLFGVYAQFLDAQSFDPNLPPQRIDVDRSDMADLFVDLNLFDWADKPVYVRGGRQELILGSQRLVSNLEWANTFRTFQGVRSFRNGDKLDVSAFWLQPILPDPSNFDSPDWRQNFTGVWTTYRPRTGVFWDNYVLNLDNSNRTAAGQGGRLGAANITTFGSRLVGDFDNQILWDLEGMAQVGRWSDQSLQAAATSSGIGYHFKDLQLAPQFWVYYDYASGDANPGTGSKFGTFNQLFPFGHYYLGYLDLVGRQNIQDVNVQLAMFPTKWVYFLVQYHNYHLASARSPLFNAAGAATRQDPTGAAGTDVGNEIDLLLNVHLTGNQDLLLGYSKLFAGSFIANTGPDVSPELFYLQHQLRW